MRAVIYFVFIFITILQAMGTDSPGLYLRAVVDKGTPYAIQLVDEDGRSVCVSTDIIISPSDVESAEVRFQEGVTIGTSYSPASHSLHFTFTPSSQPKLEKATRSMIGKKLAIIVDGKLISTPVVRSVFSKAVHFSGSFTREWADSVVERVNADLKAKE